MKALTNMVLPFSNTKVGVPKNALRDSFLVLAANRRSKLWVPYILTELGSVEANLLRQFDKRLLLI